MDKSKINLEALDDIIKEMTSDYTAKPNYNAQAAQIVQNGVQDKINARNGYSTQLTPPVKKFTPPELL